MPLIRDDGRDCGCTDADARKFPAIGEPVFSGHRTAVETQWTYRQCQTCGAVWEHLQDTGYAGRNRSGYLQRLG